MKATIYIPDDKYAIYEKAKDTLSDSISETFLRCLEREMEERKIRAERTVVELYDDKTGRRTKKAFEGAWLIGNANNGEEYFFDESTGIQGGGHYSVARTKQGRLVVVVFDRDGEAVAMEVHEDFDSFKDAEIDNRYPQYPETLVAAVASDLDINHIEELDI